MVTHDRTHKFFLRFSRTNTSITPHPPSCYRLRIPLASVYFPEPVVRLLVYFSKPVVRLSLEDVNSVAVDPSRYCVSTSQSLWPNNLREIPPILVTTEAPILWPFDKMGHISEGESRIHGASETTQSVPLANQSSTAKEIVISVRPISAAKSQCNCLWTRSFFMNWNAFKRMKLNLFGKDWILKSGGGAI